jgi:hypothetical protein
VNISGRHSSKLFTDIDILVIGTIIPAMGGISSIAKITKKHFGDTGTGTKNPIFFIPVPVSVSFIGYRSHLRRKCGKNPSPPKKRRTSPAAIRGFQAKIHFCTVNMPGLTVHDIA